MKSLEFLSAAASTVFFATLVGCGASENQSTNAPDSSTDAPADAPVDAPLGDGSNTSTTDVDRFLGAWKIDGTIKVSCPGAPSEVVPPDQPQVGDLVEVTKGTAPGTIHVAYKTGSRASDCVVVLAVTGTQAAAAVQTCPSPGRTGCFAGDGGTVSFDGGYGDAAHHYVNAFDAGAPLPSSRTDLERLVVGDGGRVITEEYQVFYRDLTKVCTPSEIITWDCTISGVATWKRQP